MALKWHHVWAIAKGLLRIESYLDKYIIGTHRLRPPGQRRHKFSQADGAAAPPAGLLHRVGGIKDHRAAKGLQLGHAAVVHVRVDYLLGIEVVNGG